MRRAVGAAAAAVVLLSGGCGVRPQDRPEPLDVPPIRSAASTGTARMTTPAAAIASVDVFFLRGARLAAVRRTVPADAAVEARASALVDGPTAAESAAGLTSAVPRPVDLRVRVDGTIAVIRVPAALTELTNTSQVLALAQIVYTVTGPVGISGVQFVDDGGPVDVLTQSGRLVPGPVTRVDYSGVAPG